MKKTILIFSSLFFACVTFAQTEVIKADPVVGTEEVKKAPQEDKKPDATIDFESKVVDYGVIEHNSDGTRKFMFTNNGTEPLVIKNAKGSCGCTVPTWPREPIAPGETSEIGVKYATNRVGKFTKTITLTTNASKKPTILTIKGEVSAPPKDVQTPEKKNEGAPLENK
ncbi:MAG: DUF1573 domain-containing protein [Bacteroidota bacterium]|nr:DUF1573 domain-containing protein [Bacteroidota bacterium]